MSLTATKGGFYTDPTPNVIQQYSHPDQAGGGATTEYCKFRTFMKAKLLGVHIFVATAGTATTHKFDILHGTSSIGSVSLSTSTAGVSTSFVPTSEVTLAAGDTVTVKSGADAAGKAEVVYEYQIASDAMHN
jgi:hypothetical protein